MSDDTLDSLLAKLNAGDAEAAERVFLAYEPYLRMVVRRRLSMSLRAKFDSMDVVQSVWADLLDGLRKARWAFTDSHQLRAFLVKMTRNRFVDGLRHHRKALEREVPMGESGLESLPAARDTRVSEEFYAGELWQQMLDSCPPAHYELLSLKRQGATIAEIATKTNLHEGSVRRILYDVARRLARLRNAAESSSR
ncbi:MAG: sigma-70 family RNA polymerase sigma factor [Pirellulales bacterium]